MYIYLSLSLCLSLSLSLPLPLSLSPFFSQHLRLFFLWRLAAFIGNKLKRIKHEFLFKMNVLKITTRNKFVAEHSALCQMKENYQFHQKPQSLD